MNPLDRASESQRGALGPKSSRPERWVRRGWTLAGQMRIAWRKDSSSSSQTGQRVLESLLRQEIWAAWWRAPAHLVNAATYKTRKASEGMWRQAGTVKI